MKISGYIWYLVALFAIVVGLYPLMYLLTEMKSTGLLSSKGSLLESTAYMAFFYAHIYGGGTALLTGWSQFKKSWRGHYLLLHRTLGKIYLVSILFFGAPAGLVIAYFANGSIPSQFGFSMLAMLWWYFSFRAWKEIRHVNIENHRDWMIRSYALTFAAVTLRIYLPIFTGAFEWDFEPSYQAISWLCWVPNMLMGEWIILRRLVRI